MKDRIIRSLSYLASIAPQAAPKDPLYQELEAHLQEKKVKDPIPQRAQEVLNLILNDYSNFSVSTIESFFQRIVRAFARELDIPLTYDIELQEGLVMEHLVGDLLLEMGENKILTRLFERFVDRNLLEEKSWHVDMEVKQLGKQIFQEKFQRLVNAYPEAENRIEKTLNLAKDLIRIRARFVEMMCKQAESALGLMGKYHLVREDFKYGKSGVGNYFQRVLNNKDFDPKSRVRAASEDPQQWYSKSSQRKAEIEAALDAGLYDILVDMVHMYDRNIKDYQTAGEVLRSIYSFGVLSDLQDRLAEYRRENGQMLISDTGLLLNRVVGNSYDAPFIYEKVGTRYLHYLLDEFQDTSDMQWESLWPLVGDALASGNGSLIVGDVKQSIYRWRNGNMQLLMHQVESQAMSQGQRPIIENLEQNWRTAREVVNFNNGFFDASLNLLKAAFEAKGEMLELAYQSLAQEPQKKAFPGLVEISFFAETEDNPLPWKEQAEEALLELILQLTNKQTGPGYDGKDITLLVRKNSEGMRLANFLQRQNIKVASAESLLVDTHMQVRFLHMVLKHLNHEEDPIVLASLRFYYAQIMEGDKKPEEVHELFKGKEIAELIPTLEASKSRLRQLAVYECLEQLLRMFPPLTQPNAYVQGFMDAALEYSSTYDASISGFLNWWEDQRRNRAIAASPVKEAVQIMTVHKSKGLEFPVVILPFANWTLEPERRDILWVQTAGMAAPYDQFPFLPISPSGSLEKTLFAGAFEEEKLQSALDNLNLLYVAMTRPEHRLYLLTEGVGEAKRKRRKRMTSVSHLIQDTLTQMKADFEPEGGAQFVWGSEEGSEGKESPEASNSRELRRNPSPMSNWNQAIRIKYSSNRYLKTDILTRTEKISAGKLVHEALAFVSVASDIPEAVERMLRMGYMAQSEAPFLQAQLEQAVNHLPVMDWYSGNWEVKNEAEIIGAAGEILRPDRVMIKGNQAVVVDYKTGMPNKTYDKQIRTYMDVLSQLGYTSVGGYVYYLSMGHVEAVHH